MDVDEIGVGYETIVPYIFEQHCARYHLIGTTHHILKQPELTWQKIYFPPRAGNSALDKVEFQWSHPQPRFAAYGGTPQEGLYPCDQFNQGKRLYKIVVSTRAQPPDTIIKSAECAQYKDGGAILFAPQSFNDCQAVDFRKQSVNDQNVMISGARQFDANRSSRCMLDHIAAMGEFSHNFDGRLIIILNEKQFRHGLMWGTCYRLAHI